MHRAMAILIVLFTATVSAAAADRSDPTFDLNAWRRLPVLEDGRRKPLDTLARESLWRITGRTSFTDPETGRKLEPLELYLEMLFRWQGWDQGQNSPMMGYFHGHDGDKWDREPLLKVGRAELREALGMAADSRRISLLDLTEAEIRDPDSGEPILFSVWVNNLRRTKEGVFDKLEEEAVKLDYKLRQFKAHRMGLELHFIPLKDETRPWLSLSALMTTYLGRQDPDGPLQKVKDQVSAARNAYLEDSPEAFNEASESMLATLREIGPKLGEYPDEAIIDLEVAYNQWKPFTYAWIFTAIASLGLVLGVLTDRKTLYAAGVSVLGVGMTAVLIGFAMRWAIKGRPPVTNLYESVLFTGLGTAAFGLGFAIWSRKWGILANAAVTTTIVLLLADMIPSVFNPAMRPLPPVLRDDFFLAVHVATVMLGYAAFIQAVGTGNVTLGYYLAGSKDREKIRTQVQFTYQSLQAGVLWLLIGTILGGLWADYSWGRFWGWDKKEVWALITLLGYLVILHARYTGWIRDRGLTFGAVLCFTFVVMTWYGVNFLSGGLHNYGLSGSEGPVWVLGVIGLQLLYAAVAIAKSYTGNPPPVGNAA